MRRIGVVVGVLVLVTTPAGCWLQPGFDARQSRWNGDETTLTSDSVEGLTELWDTAIPGAQTLAEPLSSGGTVYATAASGHVAAVDAATGALRWTRRVERPGGGSPIFDAPTLHDGGLLAPAFLPANGLPAGDLVRIDPADGSTLGGDGFDGPAYFTVAVADGVPAVMTFRVDPVGLVEVDWKYRVTNISSLGVAPARRVAVSGGHILWTWGSAAVGYSPDCEPWPPDFPAPDPGCQPDWVTTLNGTLQPPAAIGPERVVYVSSGGAVAVLDVATGAMVWTANVGGGVATPPVVAGETVLVATTNGRLVALPAAGCGAATCTALWEGQIGGTPSSAPAAGGDVAYVGTKDGDVVAFARDGCSAATCAALARLDAGAEITGGPIVHSGRVTVGTADGRLVAYGLPD